MTQSEFDAGHDGMHVPLTCENHPDLRWSCKKISVNLPDASGKMRYNQMRNIFFSTTDKPECDCPVSKLYVMVEG